MQVNKLMNFGIAVASLIVAMGAVSIARADNHRPTQANIDYAKGIAQLLQNEMIAALLQEFNETTAANAAQGKVAIGLIFNDANGAIRLIGNLSPLDPGNVPRDSFERTALFNAVKLNGRRMKRSSRAKTRTTIGSTDAQYPSATSIRRA